MDQYGTCQLDDAPMLAEKLNDGRPIIFSFSNDETNAYVISITPNMEKMGVMPFGGNPTGRFGVGVLRRGFFHFDLNRKELYPDYVGEKLGLAEYDAEAVTKMLNAIRTELNDLSA